MSHPFRDSPIRRTVWHSKYVPAGYHQGREVLTQDEEGELIASLTVTGLHAPALDMDFPVQALSNGFRTCLILGIPGPIKAHEWRNLLVAMGETGLVGPETAASGLGWLETMGQGEELRLPPPLVFDAPVTVHSSTTADHHHVYVEKEIEWEGYRRVLGHLRRVGILEDRYVQMSLRREKTMLLRPGITNLSKRGFFSKLFRRTKRGWTPPSSVDSSSFWSSSGY